MGIKIKSSFIKFGICLLIVVLFSCLKSNNRISGRWEGHYYNTDVYETYYVNKNDILVNHLSVGGAFEKTYTDGSLLLPYYGNFNPGTIKYKIEKDSIIFENGYKWIRSKSSNRDSIFVSDISAALAVRIVPKTINNKKSNYLRYVNFHNANSAIIYIGKLKNSHNLVVDSTNLINGFAIQLNDRIASISEIPNFSKGSNVIILHADKGVNTDIIDSIMSLNYRNDDVEFFRTYIDLKRHKLFVTNYHASD